MKQHRKEYAIREQTEEKEIRRLIAALLAERRHIERGRSNERLLEDEEF